MIDLSKMSKDELRQLQQQIQLELDESYQICKDSFIPRREIYDLIKPKIDAFGEVNNAHQARWIIQDDLIEICDYVLGNYEAKEIRTNKSPEFASRKQRSIYRNRFCDKTMAKRYSALATELSNVVLKYLRGEDSND